MSTFKSYSSIKFDLFCKIWKEMKFSLIFLYRKNYAEMLEFCEESLNIAKQFLLLPTDILDQVSGLYLLYGLYYKIPIENVKIQVTSKEWQRFLDLYQQSKDEKLYDASYIFVKLVMDNAFHYNLFESEYGLEKNFKFRQELPFDNPYSILPKIIDEIEQGEFLRIQNISKVYDEQKIKILNNTPSINKLQLFDKNFMGEILNKIDTLKEKKQTLTGLRKNIKVALYNRTEKNKYNFDDKIRPKLGHGFDTDSSSDDMDIEFAYVKSNDSNLPKNFGENEDDNIHKKKTRKL
ncbi:PREDICTED: snRNA-activating protein complex subunit 1 [Ceratosolen solmsi marchali]|uniref:snRNA-activating protein complex subunit 1 n=1 Tax=Ceratosolen solmsi marchali TaxID=326594 RepID=A0AAJ6YSA0_9HYME|nr:PREDICTED: snRNA-activating protein complex subunit 1 [Ceratosolen solmsi marchali]